MKKLKFVGLFLLIGLLWVNCKNRENKKDRSKVERNSEKIVPKPLSRKTGSSSVQLSKNELIVRYENGTSENEKKTIREEFPLLEPNPIQKCSCGDLAIEKWSIDTTKTSIEDAKRGLNGSTAGRAEVRGEYEFYFEHPDYFQTDSVKSEPIDIKLYYESIAKFNRFGSNQQLSVVNIAVIDTGFDFSVLDNEDFMLYDTNNTLACQSESYGWDFINNSSRVNAVNMDSHGTVVSGIITSHLDSKDIPHRILPIKAFNSKGVGSKWSVLCALNYVRELQIIRGDIHLVNASFGYNFINIQDDEKRKSLIDEEKNGEIAEILRDIDSLNTIVVASSGNDNFNNDVDTNAHFPSGFEKSVLGVGGYLVSGPTNFLAGNYGTLTIDLAAPAEIKFTSVANGRMLRREGTSYSAPKVTARIASLLHSEFLSNRNGFTAEEFLEFNIIEIDDNWKEFIRNGKYLTSP